MKPDIKSRRLELNLTLEEVGKLVGVGKSTVRKWETGDIENMKRDKIVKLANALKVSPSFIMGFDEEVKETKEDKSTTGFKNFAAHLDGDLTDEEWQEVIDYANYIRTKRDK